MAFLCAHRRVPPHLEVAVQQCQRAAAAVLELKLPGKEVACKRTTRPRATFVWTGGGSPSHKPEPYIPSIPLCPVLHFHLQLPSSTTLLTPVVAAKWNTPGVC